MQCSALHSTMSAEMARMHGCGYGNAVTRVTLIMDAAARSQIELSKKNKASCSRSGEANNTGVSFEYKLTNLCLD